MYCFLIFFLLFNINFLISQEVHLDKKVKLLDCPGIVFASGADKDVGEIMLRNCVKVEKIADPIQPGKIFLLSPIT